MYYYSIFFSIAFLLFSPIPSQSSNIIENNNYNNTAQKVNDLFDINEAYTQLMFAYSAYCPEAKIVNWNCFFCTYNMSDTKGFKVETIMRNAPTNTFGYVGNLGNTIEVVFRGTQPSSLQNWITDLDFAPHSKTYPDYPKAKVHSGFLDAYDAVKISVRSAVQYLVNTTKTPKVIFTGHSLGAALATLAAVDLAPILIKQNIPFYVYNYGSPRVGNQVFSDYYKSLVPYTMRITNRADIVPHLPMKDMGFYHVAQEVWWNSATHYNLCDLTGEDKKCCDSEKLWSIPDHLNYLHINLDQGGCA